jgi:macrodomain Ter protein organizer (MatP/YcbG family)
MEQTINNERTSTMNLEIQKMTEAEALIWTAWERLNSAKDQMSQAEFETMEYKLDDHANEYFDYRGIWNEASITNWKNNLQSLLGTYAQNKIGRASAIGHTVGHLGL